jgi:glycosyltransferase involved in cell wall biosynthesis
MIISVLVPTYRRPNDLRRCLNALEKQTRKPDEIVIVFRLEDSETRHYLDRLSSGLCLRKVDICEPGVVAAYNLGLENARGDIIAITDDDAAPHPTWLERIESHFARDPEIGAVGGRDFLYRENRLVNERKSRVGAVQWFGRAIGNQHAGFGTAREVEILKGVNMSYRREAITGLRFDRRLRGSGAQVHVEMGFSLSVRRRGWRIIYDPAVAVDHFLGVRHDIDKRHVFNAVAMSDAVHNETLVLLDYLPPVRRFIFLAWSLLIGHRAAPGLVQWVRFRMKGDPEISAKLHAAIKGRLDGYKTWARSRMPGPNASDLSST